MTVNDQDQRRMHDHSDVPAPGGAHSTGNAPPDEPLAYDAEPRHRRPVEPDSETIAGSDLPEDC